MIKLMLIVGGIWLAWRAFVYLWNIFRPVRSAANKKVISALESAGQENLATNYSRLNQSIENAVDANINISIVRVLIWLVILAVVFAVLFWSFSNGR